MPVAISPLDMIARLVAFDTTSRNSNLELIHFVRDYLDGHGIASTLIHDTSGAKANLFATIGPESDGGVVLSGHTDVVPVDGQPWESDPFRVFERDGLLYGRGTADMKSFCAVALSLVPEFRAAALKVPVHLAFSYDEEVGCLGVHGLVDHLRRNGPRPSAIVVGEPTEMQVVDAHKSMFLARTTVFGLEAHSSATHRGVNAIVAAAELIAELERVGEELKRTDNPDAARFDPPHDTLSIGLIEGGTATNIIPRRCCFHWGQRSIPGNDTHLAYRRLQEYCEKVLLPRMRAIHPEASVENEILITAPGLRPEPGSPAEQLSLALVGSNRTHAVSYGTEAGIFQDVGIPTVVCGPGNIREAHKPNEFIEMTQVEACIGFMRRLMQRLSN
ncbi:MAG: acetylornithine deacetylase [Alphaproteobacteria bacterium]|nr:acetylornithine deacetylase [Alphaproteobacteria bacterium]